MRRHCTLHVCARCGPRGQRRISVLQLPWRLPFWVQDPKIMNGNRSQPKSFDLRSSQCCGKRIKSFPSSPRKLVSQRFTLIQPIKDEEHGRHLLNILQILTVLKAQWYETWLHSYPPGRNPFVLPLTNSPSSSELRTTHHAEHTAWPRAHSSVGSTDATATRRVRRRELYRQGLLWLGSSSDCQELNLRQYVYDDEQHGREQSQALLFKPQSSTQLSTGCPF